MQNLNIKARRIYTVLNILEGFGFLKRHKKGCWIKGEGEPHSKLGQLIRMKK